MADPDLNPDVEEPTPEEYQLMMHKAFQDNDTDEALRILGKDVNVNEADKDGWVPLAWASFHGNEKLVKQLLKEHHAASIFIHDNEDEKDIDEEGEEDIDPFRKPKIAAEEGKYTPLHWAAYKAHHRIVWYLLKEGMSPLDIDMHGNTSIHQAAAAGAYKVMECFLSYGVDVEQPNARGHKPIDLATDPDTKKLLMDAIKTANCSNCQSHFNFKNLRYLCLSSYRFYCSNCSKVHWDYELPQSEEMERPVCRST